MKKIISAIFSLILLFVSTETIASASPIKEISYSKKTTLAYLQIHLQIQSLDNADPIDPSG